MTVRHKLIVKVVAVCGALIVIGANWWAWHLPTTTTHPDAATPSASTSEIPLATTRMGASLPTPTDIDRATCLATCRSAFQFRRDVAATKACVAACPK